MKHFKVVLYIIDRIDGKEETIREIVMTDYCGEHTPKIGENIIISKEDISCKVDDIVHYFDDIYSVHEIRLFSFRYTGTGYTKVY